LQAFYLCGPKKPHGIVVSPSRKLILVGVKAKKSQHEGEQVSNNGFLKRFGSLFLWLLGGSLGYLDKYSHVVYDGDRLTVYGSLSYNTASERWEMKNPIAILLQGETFKEATDSERMLLDELSSQITKAGDTTIIYLGISFIMMYGGLVIALDLLIKYGPYFQWKIKRMANNIYVKIKNKLLAFYHWFVPAPPPQVPQPEVVIAQP
jgi:hypothetical protein